MHQVATIITVIAHPTDPPCTGSHCWHYSPLQHTVTNHRDELCCHCGSKRCLSVQGFDHVGAKLGHGKHVQSSWYA